MKRLFSRRVVLVVAVVLLGLWLLRPGVGRLRGKVSSSIAQALGRKVEIGAVHWQFLPRPGFELENLVIYDDPRFGAEPLLRAPDVTASLRLLSMLRGRIEIANLNLTEASLNLTRNAQGQWNLEDLVNRTSHSSLAPTSAAKRDSTPAFPYIEATRARVNFKLGDEKTHFAFSDAEFALWQESRNTWGARLKARPIRTDANLTDTGELDASAFWRRSAAVRETPLRIMFQWKQAQLGQFSKLFSGTDKGFRGGVLLSGTVTGTPEHLNVQADGSIDDFRQEDVIGGGDLRLVAHCSADYESAIRALSNLDCTAPSGGGFLELKGGARGVLAAGKLLSDSNVWVVVNKIPTESILSFARHIKLSVPQDLKTSGALTLNLQIIREKPDQPVTYHADGSIQGLVISNGDVSEIAVETVPLSLDSQSPPQLPSLKHVLLHRPRESEHTSDLPSLAVGPVNLAIGKPGPLTAEALISRNGYEATFQGEAGLGRFLQVAKAFRIPSPTVAADGTAKVKMQIAGEWDSGKGPEVTGSAELRSVRAQVAGLNSAVEIKNADLTIQPGEVKVQNLSAQAAETAWHGSMLVPRPCANPSACELQFKLHTPELNSAALNRLFNPSERKGPWYRFLSRGSDSPAYLLRARATGTINIDKLAIGRSTCSHFSSELILKDGEVSLSHFEARCLDGDAAGQWNADFSVKPPRYRGTGIFKKVSLGQVAEWMHNDWIDGHGSAKYEFKATGRTVHDLLASADLRAEFSVLDGRFPRVVLAKTSEGLRTESFTGNLSMREGIISFNKAKLASGPDVYTVSGTASLTGELNLKALAQNANGFSVTGTLLKTRTAPIPATEADLKP